MDTKLSSQGRIHCIQFQNSMRKVFNPYLFFFILLIVNGKKLTIFDNFRHFPQNEANNAVELLFLIHWLGRPAWMKEHLVREISPKVSKKDQMYHTSEKPNSFHGLRACLGLNEMNSSLVVFYKFGRICVCIWPENNGYILLTSEVETPFEILEFVRILPRTVGFCLKHLLKSLWGKAKLLSGLIHSEKSRLLKVGECPNKWVCVCFWACFT